MYTFPHWARAWSAVLVLLTIGAGQPRAQGETSSALSAAEQQALAAEQVRRQATDRILAMSGIPLEGALDPETYVVGPGDVFNVSIGGSVPVQLAPIVTADGALVIAEVGSLQVAGLTLAESQIRVKARLRQSFRNVPVGVSLAQPRQFYVHVSGEVARPGRHIAVPIARVEDAVAVAMEGGNPLRALEMQRRESWNYDALPALRNVEVQRRNGERLLVDLRRYYATGDPASNPYLQDGDRIYVPGFRETEGAIFVERETQAEGGRDTPGTPNRSRAEFFDYRRGDTVTDLLLVAGGPELLAETNSARLLRTRPDGTLDIQTLDVQAIVAGTESDVPLQPRDRLLLPDRAEQAGAVEAAGYVVYPGTYPIIEGETTLRDLVAAAGGIRPDGLLRAAYLERRGRSAEPAPPVRDGMTDRDQRAALLEAETFENARLSGLPFGSRRYLTREVLEFQRVSLDLSGGVESLPEVPLRDGDRLVVPRDPGGVFVVGQVRHPGYVAFAPGAEAAYYLEQAGGLGPAATEVYLREAGSGALRSPNGAPIRSGDALFVDRIPTADTESLQSLALQEQSLLLQEERERANRRLQFVQTGISLIGAVATVITTYLLISDGGR